MAQLRGRVGFETTSAAASASGAASPACRVVIATHASTNPAIMGVQADRSIPRTSNTRLRMQIAAKGTSVMNV